MFLEQQPNAILAHSPHSPDMAPCEIIAFTRVKNIALEKSFESVQDAADAFDDDKPIA